jgi:TfoX/Sxy family transcriptional regulator of competence genes
MKWTKVPPENIESFDAALPSGPGIERRKMFGCPAGFVNGNMFCGAHQGDILIRLEEKAREKALREPGFAPFNPMGRPMKEYVCVPRERTTDAAYLKRWFRRAHDYAATLPPKSAKAAKPASRPKAKARSTPAK